MFRKNPCFYGGISVKNCIVGILAAPINQFRMQILCQLTHQWTQACPKPSVGDCFLIGLRLAKHYGDLHFGSIHLLPIMLFWNIYNFIFVCPGYNFKTTQKGMTGSTWSVAHLMCLQAFNQWNTPPHCFNQSKKHLPTDGLGRAN